ncbi:MAG: hypothetical protein ABI977_23765 [Acidobacteriota bacterium]
MIAFDTNVLTEILLGNSAMIARAKTISPHLQAVPVIVIEEIIRGRLNVIRQAEAGKSKLSLERAYALFQETYGSASYLPYTTEAETLFRQWRQQGIRVSHTRSAHRCHLCHSRCETDFAQPA